MKSDLIPVRSRYGWGKISVVADVNHNGLKF